MIKSLITSFVLWSGVALLGAMALNAEGYVIRDQIALYNWDNIPLEPAGLIRKSPGMDKWVKVTNRGCFRVVKPNDHSTIEHKKAWDHQEMVLRSLTSD